MFRTRVNLTAGLVILLLSAASVFAEDSTDAIKPILSEGNPVAGKAKSVPCQECHGVDGNSPKVEIPKLAGQYAAYIQKQLRDFKSGARTNPEMTKVLSTMTNDQDLLDIATYFASQGPMKADGMKVDKEAGEMRYKGMGCIGCHVLKGEGGGRDNFVVPKIGGQHKAYMVKQLKDFREGDRSNDPHGVMSKLVIFLTDEDIENVTNYVSEM
jgi:cytochrome c553